MKILAASTNPAKLVVLSKVIFLAGHETITPSDMTDIEWPTVVESGSTLVENAKMKAQSFAMRGVIITIATDEGLRVDKYSPEANRILAIEPRRLGLGRRATDKEVIAWHNRELEKIGGSSPACFTTALAVATPDGKIAVKNFFYQMILMTREANFPKVRPGYPLDSQSKSIKFGKFISELTDKERLEDMPIREMAGFLSEQLIENTLPT